MAERPVSWVDSERRVFGMPPGRLPAATAAVAFLGAVVAFALGAPTVGALLLAACLPLVALQADQARRHARALAGFAGASVRAWTGAGRVVASLRLEASRLSRERARLQYALGGAVYADDHAAVGELRRRLHGLDAQIEACAAEATDVVERARARTADERLAVAPTEIREPVGDPGFEPGTSALSERRSNQLS
jgi:hypothetical protein